MTSIYELIRVQVERAPDAPLDLDAFPDIPLGPGSELTVIAGLHDHIATGPNREPSEIVDAIRRAIDGRCSWRELEVELDQTSMVRQFDLVAQQLGRDGLTSQATAGFRELARSSGSYEAVKWGVTLGYIDAAAGGRLEQPDVDFLLDLARHPELTAAASLVLGVAADADPELKLVKVRLLALTEGWGVVQLVGELGREPDLMADVAVQRQVLVYGAKNGAQLAMECYFDIARIIQFPDWIERAHGDDEVFAAVLKIMGGLCTEPEPVGGLADRPDAEQLIERFVVLLQARAPSVELLNAIDDLDRFFGYMPEWPTGADWRRRLAGLYQEKRSLEVLACGLEDGPDWMASAVIRRHHEAELAPQVAQWHLRGPSWSSVWTLGAIGRPEDQDLVAAPLEAVDWAPRRSRERLNRRSMPKSEELVDQELARYVSVLARWPNARSERLIVSIADDFNPDMRSAAATAIGRWPARQLSPALTETLERLLRDGAMFVVDRAIRAAETHGIDTTTARSHLKRLQSRLMSRRKRTRQSPEP